jgi:hypothetical protein
MMEKSSIEGPQFSLLLFLALVMCFVTALFEMCESMGVPVKEAALRLPEYFEQDATTRR